MGGGLSPKHEDEGRDSEEEGDEEREQRADDEDRVVGHCRTPAGGQRRALQPWTAQGPENLTLTIGGQAADTRHCEHVRPGGDAEARRGGEERERGGVEGQRVRG
eukprot:3788649-Rhodomonas_salina.4